MDALFFLNQRTTFVRQFYDTAAAPFVERKRKIEAGEEPYEPVSFEDNEEPPFLTEWTTVDESLDTLGQMCVSLLANALHLYLKAWDKGLGLGCEKCSKKVFKRDGWINGYRHCFQERVGIRWEECPVDLGILEEIVMARNRTQHPEHIISNRVSHSGHDLAKLKKVYFADDFELDIIASGGDQNNPWWFTPTVKVTGAKLHGAVDAVEGFCDWLDRRIASLRTPGTQ